jgi:hypothetical protein
MTPKKGKSQAPPMAKKILSDGEVRDAPTSPAEQKLKPKVGKLVQKLMGAVKGAQLGGAPLGAVAPGAPMRTNLGGGKPEKPRAKDTPKPSRQMAIGERPVLPKTAAKMKKMGR